MRRFDGTRNRVMLAVVALVAIALVARYVAPTWLAGTTSTSAIEAATPATTSATLPAGATTQPITDGLLVYHQLTNLSHGTGRLDFPVLSADGTTAVFADSAGHSAMDGSNRIFVVDASGGEPIEVDAYSARQCLCSSLVAVSADGSTVVSSA